MYQISDTYMVWIYEDIFIVLYGNYIEYINMDVMVEDYKEYWKEAKAESESSYSQLHFGHHKAPEKDGRLS